MIDAHSVKYPQITVKLLGYDGNAFAILGKVRRHMRRAGLSDEQIHEFTDEATKGDYDHLLRTCMKYVNVE